ncbi:MAG: prepilin peptidase [Actinomycetota bacterium]
MGVAAFLLGTAFGSFANLVIYRVAPPPSATRAASVCPACGAPAAWFERLPLISYAILLGRCRHCGDRISPRYPLVELIVGAAWAAVALRVRLRPELPAFLAFATVLVILSVIDLLHHRLPNRILGPAGVVAVILLGSAAAVEGEWGRLAAGALGAASYGALMWILVLVAPGQMGAGDAKFAAYLGLHLGWLGAGEVVAGALLAFFTGAVTGLLLLIAGRKGWKDFVPFGPFMAAGALIPVLLGDVAAGWVSF